MFHIACTRFNSSTYNENIEYRKKWNEEVIYGAALKIRDIYSAGSLIFVAEMNNETNKVEGIGLIKNLLVSDKRHKIYENGDYNRYIYRGTNWISRTELEQFDKEIIEILDNILFKGKSHLKYRTGITVLTEKLFTHWNYELRTLKNKIKSVFHNLKEFKEEDDLEKVLEEEKEFFEIIPKKLKRNKKNIEK